MKHIINYFKWWIILLVGLFLFSLLVNSLYWVVNWSFEDAVFKYEVLVEGNFGKSLLVFYSSIILFLYRMYVLSGKI